jgi:hypothetical protein
MCRASTRSQSRRAVALSGASVLWVVAALVGCQQGGDTNRPSTGQAPPTAALQHPALENLPLPAGFELVRERSMARKAGRMRIGQCEFIGPATPDDVSRFYEKYMPTAKFTLKERGFNNGEYALRFESDDEVCNIRARPAKGKTVLVIDIGPLLKGGAEPRPPDYRP